MARPPAASRAASDPLASVTPRRAVRVREALAGLPRHRPALVGVSGGRDSVLLLALLRHAGFTRLTVCHLNHRLRGRAAETDAKFVRRLALASGCAFIDGRVDVAALARRSGVALEAAGRMARHALFARAGVRTGARRLFLGHHGDDRVETFLFHLFRGAAGRGLSSLRARSTLRLDGLRFDVVRPLLALLRADIDAAVAAGRMVFREDRTNRSPTAVRNRIRHDLIPAIEAALGRPVREAVWRAAEILEAEEAWMESLVPAPRVTLDVKQLRALPVGAQRRQIAAWLRARGVSDIGFEAVEGVRGLLQPDGPARAQLAGGRLAARRAGVIRVSAQA
jgi:tRNA(Ile)-lysidine synthase